MDICMGTKPQCLDQVIKSSTQSWMGSVVYLENLIPLAIINVLSNRISFEANFFAEQSLNGVKYNIPSPFVQKRNEHILAKVLGWIKSIVDLVKKEYLTEIFLIMQKDTDDTAEYFRFSVKYVDKERVKLPGINMMVEETKNFLICINMLGLQKKIPADCRISMQISVREGAPSDLRVPYFEDSEPIVFPNETNSNYVLVASVDTGYHRFKVSVRGALYEIDYEPETETDGSIVTKTVTDAGSKVLAETGTYADGNVEATVVLDSENIEEAVGSGILSPQESEEISCSCELSCSLPSIETVQCTMCSKFQHVGCTGYMTRTIIPDPHICISCCILLNVQTDDAILGKIEDRERRTLLSQIRLIAFYALKVDRDIGVVLAALPGLNRALCIKLLLKSKAVSKIDGKFIALKHKVFKMIVFKYYNKDYRREFTSSGSDSEMNTGNLRKKQKV